MYMWGQLWLCACTHGVGFSCSEFTDSFLFLGIHTGKVGHGSNDRESLFKHRKEAKALIDG